MKDNRKIIRGIRALKPSEGHRIARSITYSDGMEDELAAAFTQAELNAMVERGDITGNWKSTQGQVKKATGGDKP